MQVPNSVASAPSPVTNIPAPVTNVHKGIFTGDRSLLVLLTVLPVFLFSTLTFASVEKQSPSKYIVSFPSWATEQKKETFLPPKHYDSWQRSLFFPSAAT